MNLIILPMSGIICSFGKKINEFGEEEFQSMKRTLMKFIGMKIEDCYIIKTKHCK